MKSLLLAAALAPLGSGAQPADSERRDVTLVVYDSFPSEGTHVDALERFSEDTGIDVELLVAGDTGTMVAKAVLTAGNPEGDVMWGVDNTYLSRVVDEGVFDPYEADGLVNVADELTTLVPEHEATPVDFGDVCVNYDIAWFDEHGVEPPSDLESLAAPEYADLLVVQNPASSSPGLAFLMATVAEFGDEGWIEYWQRLVDNGVEVVDGWTEAYYERFSGAGDGPKPLVVSYGSSPPAEVLFADPPVERGADGRRRRHVLPPGRVRRRVARHRRAGRSPPPRRLPRQRGLPGGGRPQPVRLPGEHRGRTAARVHRLLRRRRGPLHARPGDDRRHRDRLDRNLDRDTVLR